MPEALKDRVNDLGYLPQLLCEEEINFDLFTAYVTVGFVNYN